jgi:hypothetical protein
MLSLLALLTGCTATCDPGFRAAADGHCYALDPGSEDPADDTGAAGQDGGDDGAGDDGGDDTGDDTDAPPDTGPDGDTLAFAGIYSVTWDGADGLTAAWDPADSEGLTYTATLELGGEVIDAVETGDLSAGFTGLADGEYRLRVEAEDDQGRTGGAGVSLTQLVGENRVVYRSEIPLWGAMDVWGEGDVVALAGGYNDEVDVLIADISDPAAPQTLAAIEGLEHVRDVKLGDGLLFVSEDCNCFAGTEEAAAWQDTGVWIYDLADPADPRLLSAIGAPDSSIHNIAYGDGALYLTSNFENAFSIYDVSDPAAPERLAAWAPPSGSAHDQTWVDGRLYTAWTTGFSVLDVSAPASPVEIARYEGLDEDFPSYHNAWPAADPDVVLTSQEKVGGALQIWDLSGDPFDPEQIGSWLTSEDHSIHNAYSRGDYALIAWYVDGLLIFDLTEPSTPELVGWYDSYDGEEGPMEPLHSGVPDGEPTTPDALPRISGAWGLWPYGDHLALGDTERGLLLFDFFPPEVTVDGAAW